MRPVGDRRLMRYQVVHVVAAERMGGSDARVSNLLSPVHGEFAKGLPTLSDWDGSAGSGGSGGCRIGSFAPEPFSGAA